MIGTTRHNGIWRAEPVVSAGLPVRVDMVVEIGYSDDIGRAKAVLTRVLKEDARVLAEPEPKIGVVELADSSVNFVVRPWVKLAFDADGLSIPFPQQDVHMHTAA